MWYIKLCNSLTAFQPPSIMWFDQAIIFQIIVVILAKMSKLKISAYRHSNLFKFIDFIVVIIVETIKYICPNIYIGYISMFKNVYPLLCYNYHHCVYSFPYDYLCFPFYCCTHCKHQIISYSIISLTSRAKVKPGSGCHWTLATLILYCAFRPPSSNKKWRLI